VKRKLIAATALAGTAALLIGVGAVWARPDTPAPAAPAAAPVRTRIGLLNISYVLKNYKKYQTYQDDVKGEYDRFDKQAKELQLKMEALNKAMKDPQTNKDKLPGMEKEMKDLTRSLQDVQEDAKAALGKKGDDKMVEMYREIQNASIRLATERGFDLIMHYNDVVDNKDYYTAPNVARKIQAGACMPMYYANGMEISVDIVTALNAAYKPTAAAPAAAPGGVTPVSGRQP
jgi:Skp family chaperone for outer membrane proteins